MSQIITREGNQAIGAGGKVVATYDPDSGRIKYPRGPYKKVYGSQIKKLFNDELVSGEEEEEKELENVADFAIQDEESPALSVPEEVENATSPAPPVKEVPPAKYPGPHRTLSEVSPQCAAWKKVFDKKAWKKFCEDYRITKPSRAILYYEDLYLNGKYVDPDGFPVWDKRGKGGSR